MHPPARRRVDERAHEGRADRRDGRGALADVPGVEFNFTQPMAMRLDEVVSGVKADVAVKVFGPDAATLERLGRAGRGTCWTACPGAADLQVEVLSGAAQIEIVVDRATDGALRARTWRTCASWSRRPSAARRRREILDGSRRFDVVVRFPGRDPGEPGGDRGPAADRARRRAGAARAAWPTWRRCAGPEAINHENGERRLVVQTNVRGRDVGSFVAEAQRRLGGAGDAARRLLPDVGRPVREPAARHGAAHARGPAVARDHLPAAVRHVRQHAPGGARDPQRAVRARRRHRRALAARSQPEPLGRRSASSRCSASRC